MLLIISGQYVESELRAEFGKIPPTFLPLGNQRLYVHQVRELARSYGSIALSLPSDFQIDEADAAALRRLNVSVLRTGVGKRLGAAVQEALAHVDAQARIDILYGDTLVFEDELGGTDWIAVGNSDEFYPWHYENEPEGGADDEEAWAGMFSFSDAGALRRLLHQDGDFIAAVTRYGREHRSLERRPLKRWLDFGHVHTYFHSRLAMTTQRHFNQLSVAGGVVTKSSSDTRKMCAEAAWFESAPPAVKPFLPNLIRPCRGDAGNYAIEYLPLTSLSELYVFGQLPVKVWKKVFAACDRYLCAERSVPVAERFDMDARRTYHDKTLARLETFARQTGVDLDREWRFNGSELPSLRDMTEHAYAAVRVHPPVPSFVHGDLCFSNILYDFRSDRIKLIDPRGLDADGNTTPFGDLRYDIAKLAHSVVGLYDAILAGRFSLGENGQNIAFDVQAAAYAPIQEAFLARRFAGRTPDDWDCQPIMVLLFLSMLPLHVDQPSRQRALMANSMRIYQAWAESVEYAV